jgi:hypothetical protein
MSENSDKGQKRRSTGAIGIGPAVLLELLELLCVLGLEVLDLLCDAVSGVK